MDREPPVTVSQLNQRAKKMLDEGFAKLWVEGEISNLSRPASGHIYLTLKDDAAQVTAAWFRGRQRGPAHNFKNGDQVLAYGQVSLYVARGSFQLIIEQIEPAGEGVLKRRFDALKKKLDDEGLFDPETKRPLPALPQRIGIITSPSGAAVRDMLTVLRRRFPAIPVIIYPAAVQGDAAAGELIAALDRAVARNECDVLVLTRGGGSLEDLWAFNDEQLARRIAACPLPVISAVGHEIDFTIADFVADLRAPTPSGAAELLVPDQADWLQRCRMLSARLARVGERTVQDRAQQLDWLTRRMVQGSPRAMLNRQAGDLREVSSRLLAAARRALHTKQSRLHNAHRRLIPLSPARAVLRSTARSRELRQRLVTATRDLLSDKTHRLALLGRGLNSVSPLATLERGYAIVQPADGDAVIRDASTLSSGSEIRARLARGALRATVSEVESNDD